MRLSELCEVYELGALYELYKLYEYLMNRLKSLKITWYYLNWFKFIFVFKNFDFFLNI